MVKDNEKYLGKEANYLDETLFVQQRQGHKREKTMAVKLIYIPKDDTKYYCGIGLKLVVESFKHLT